MPLDRRFGFAEAPGYLNFASFGPPSRRVTATIAEVAESAAVGAADLHRHDDEALVAVARLTGFPRDACVLTTSTSAGLQQLAFGLPGAEILVGVDEFPSNRYPWWRAQEAGLLTVREIPRPAPGVLLRITPETIAAALRPSTTAVTISAVDFRTGHRADLAGIRAVIGERLLIVDGIQGFGVLDQDWTFADALVVGGQKWLRAGWGTGFTALSPRALDRIRPTLGSWTAVEHPTEYDNHPHPLRAGAARLSVTNASPFTSAALRTALELLESAGVGAVQQQIEHSVDTLIGGLDAAGIALLSPREPQQRAGIVVARVPADHRAQALDRLSEAGVTATAHAPDRIRFSVHASTTPAAFDTVVAVLTSLP